MQTTIAHDEESHDKEAFIADRKLNIIIVEDEEEFTDAIDDAIAAEVASYSLKCFSRGEDALRFISRPTRRIDLAMVDLGLPDVSGHEVVRHIRSIGKDTPIVVISSFISRENFVGAVRAGASGFLSKDSDVDNLSIGIRNIINGRSPISPYLTSYLLDAAAEKVKSGEEILKLLSRRELQLLKLLACGLTYIQCAHELDLQVSTIHAYSKTLYRKLGIHSKSQAILVAQKAGLID